ncbi:MAG: carbonic anhydrase [Phycisphaerae bacterium]|nr:carbonic anhydrase [Phycisphaerae bacterium]
MVSCGKAAETASAIPADEAMKLLWEGNARWLAGKSQHPHADAPRRAQTAEKGQHPFATIVSCSDSRVPVEMIFDAGIGDLFVVRVAGNVCGVDEIGSVEYGTDHLGTSLVIVLGHTKCGAVTAVVTKAELHGKIPRLVEPIRPAVVAAQKAHPDLHGEALVPAAIKANVWQGIQDILEGSPTIRQRAKDGKVRIVGAIYDLTEGKVEWLGTHPEQKRLLALSEESDRAKPAGAHASAKPSSAVQRKAAYDPYAGIK